MQLGKEWNGNDSSERQQRNRSRSCVVSVNKLYGVYVQRIYVVYFVPGSNQSVPSSNRKLVVPVQLSTHAWLQALLYSCVMCHVTCGSYLSS